MEQAIAAGDIRRYRIMQVMAARRERRQRVLRLFHDEPLIVNLHEIVQRVDDPDFTHAHACIAVSELVSRGRLDTSIRGIRRVR